MNYKPYKHLPPFKGMVLQNFPFIEEDFDAITNYQLLCKIVEYLRNVIANELIMEENITNLYNSFVELKNYVDNYFDNLDVQEEINNKLDEMVEDGTLQDLISDFIIGGNGQVKYVFPSKTSITSEYNLICGFNKNILIDCGLSQEYSNLTDTLTKYNVNHIDYMIVTHFHIDHCENLINLYEDNYCDSDTVLILPTFNTSVWATNSAYEQYITIMNYLNNNNIRYIIPSEGQQFSINENFNFNIYNTNDTYYIDNNINSDYNNASLIVLVKHFNNNSLYTGDCYKHALNKIYNDGVIPYTLHLYKMGHHGIDNRDNSIIEFVRNLNIINAIQIVGLNDIVEGKCSRGGTYIDVKGITDNIFITAYNKKNITFSSFINSFNLTSGFNQSGTDNLNYTNETIYVDIVNATNYQNGTSNYPFKNLSQALGYIEKNNGRNYTIYVKNGTYENVAKESNAKPTLYNVGNSIKIIGEGENTILNYGFTIINCKNIQISNLKIINKMDARCFNIDNSNVILNQVIYDKAEEINNQYFLYAENNSDVKITQTSISNALYGIYEVDSNITLDNITFTNIANHCIYGENGKFVKTENLTVTDSSVLHGRYSEDSKPLYEKGLILFSGSHNYSDGNITNLIARPARFRYIDVEYNVNSYKKVQRFLMTGSTYVCGLNDLFVANDGNDYLYSLALSVGDNYTGTFNYSRISVTNRTTREITFTNNTDSLTITKIIAH